MPDTEAQPQQQPQLSSDARAKIEAARRRIVDRNVNPLLASLPEKFVTFPPHQVAAIEQVVDAFNRVSVVVLDAPTGSGKTVIGETVRRMMQTSAIYICSSKSLQDQFLSDFTYARVLKGRANYPTVNFPRRFHPNEYAGHLSCADCTWTKNSPTCKWCPRKDQCTYEVAKHHALQAEVAVLNTAYFLTECNGPGRFSRGGFVIADEADTLEANLMEHVGVEISPSRMKRYQIGPPPRKSQSRPHGGSGSTRRCPCLGTNTP